MSGTMRDTRHAGVMCSDLSQNQGVLFRVRHQAAQAGRRAGSRIAALWHLPLSPAGPSHPDGPGHPKRRCAFSEPECLNSAFGKAGLWGERGRRSPRWFRRRPPDGTVHLVCRAQDPGQGANRQGERRPSGLPSPLRLGFLAPGVTPGLGWQWLVSVPLLRRQPQRP